MSLRWLGLLRVWISCFAFQCCLVGSEICVTVDDYAEMPLSRAWVSIVPLPRPKNGDKEATSVSRTHAGSTDKNGRACFEVPAGRYSVESGLMGFLNVRYYPITVTPAHRTELPIRLPIGEVIGDSVSSEATLFGTLRRDGYVLQGVTVCLLREESVVICQRTNAFGEYVLSVAPGEYHVEIRNFRNELISSLKVDAAFPEPYEDLIIIENRAAKKPDK